MHTSACMQQPRTVPSMTHFMDEGLWAYAACNSLRNLPSLSMHCVTRRRRQELVLRPHAAVAAGQQQHIHQPTRHWHAGLLGGVCACRACACMRVCVHVCVGACVYACACGRGGAGATGMQASNSPHIGLHATPGDHGWPISPGACVLNAPYTDRLAALLTAPMPCPRAVVPAGRPVPAVCRPRRTPSGAPTRSST